MKKPQNREDGEDEINSREKEVIRKILSRLSLIREDIKIINRLKDRTSCEEVRKIIVKFNNRSNQLYNKLIDKFGTDNEK